MNNIYEIIPLDTLFFRGSTPMEKGQYNTVSLFPPPVSVIKGAFWSEYCNIKNCSYTELLVDNNIPITVNGIFIKKDNTLYAPCPSIWYYDSDDKKKSGKELDGIKICKTKDKSKEFEELGIFTSAGNVGFVTAEHDAKPLSSCWISVNELKKDKEKFSKTDILMPSDIYSTEQRTGNQLDENKITKEGALYSSTHIRLNDGISLAVSLDFDMEVNEGVFTFGGEKRIAKYKKIDSINIFDIEENDCKEYVSLVPIEASEENINSLVSSGKLVTVSGWDLHKGFHKPSVTYIPSGAVFNKKINNSCIPLV